MVTATSSIHVALAKPLTFASCEASKSSIAVTSTGIKDPSWMKLKSSCHISSTHVISQNVTSNHVKFNKMVTKAMSESTDTKPLPGLPVDLRGKRAFIAEIEPKDLTYERPGGISRV